MQEAPAIEPVSARTLVRRLVPFALAVVVAFPLAVVGHAEASDLHLVLWAALALITCGLLSIWPGEDAARWSWGLSLPAFCIGVALLRHVGGGAASGLDLLLLLPIVWQAVYGRRLDVSVAVAATVLTLAVPVVIIGPPEYPTQEWQRVIMASIAFSLAGFVVHRLVRRLHEQQAMFSEVLLVGRVLGTAADVRSEVCAALVRIVGVASVVLCEVEGPKRIRVTSSLGVDLPTISIDFDELPELPRLAVVTREPVFVPDTLADRRTDLGLQKLIGYRSVYYQPIVRADRVVGVLSLGWHRPRRRVSTEVRQVIEMLSTEAAIAIERHDLLRTLDLMARHDPLTNVLNRRAWDEVLDNELRRVRRTGTPSCIAIIDLDHFKQFNDSYGHVAGDKLLADAAGVWARELRAIDALARWGGEEFAVLMPGVDAATAVLVIDRLRQATPHDQTFSAGIVALDGRDALGLTRAADAALYRAKSAGRNRSVVAPPLASAFSAR